MKTFFKLKPFRSEKYRKWVSELPSCVSQRPADDPHHIKRPGFGGTSKAPDWLCIPLTREEHTEFHMIGWHSFEEKYSIDQRDAVLNTLELAFAQGVLGECK